MEMARPLVVLSVAAPVLVGGATLLLLAQALAGSWLWGLVLVVCVLVAYLGSCAALVRWARSHPEQAEGFMGSWGRAMAFGSGGWEPRRKGREDDEA